MSTEFVILIKYKNFSIDERDTWVYLNERIYLPDLLDLPFLPKIWKGSISVRSLLAMSTSFWSL